MIITLLAMSKNTVLVAWYERDSGEIRSHIFIVGALKRGGSYLNEASYIARDPVEMIEIHSAFGDVAGELGRFRKRAEAYRATLAKG